MVVGQGPVGEIAENLGFKKVTTMEEYRLVFPTLDAVDHERRKCMYKKYMVYTCNLNMFEKTI